MAEAAKALLADRPMKHFHERFDKLDDGLADRKQDLAALRGDGRPMQTDIHNIYGILTTTAAVWNESSVILEPCEMAEPQRPCDHNP